VLVAAGCGGSKAAAPPPPVFKGSTMDPPLRAADFTLRDQDGKRVRMSVPKGTFQVVAFLYTQCPDVCPLIASNLNQALRHLTPAERAKVRVLAVSVDPANDTPKAVDRYVKAHRLLPQFRYLTGTRAQLQRVWKAYHIAVDPANLDTVSHSSYELLVDPRRNGHVLYDAGVQWDDVVHDVRVLMRRE
jgi:protein SCO1/2